MSAAPIDEYGTCFSSIYQGSAVSLSNFLWNTAARMKLNTAHHELSPWSVSIFPDCQNAVFITAASVVLKFPLECTLSQKLWSKLLKEFGSQWSMHQSCSQFLACKNVDCGLQPLPFLLSFFGQCG